MYCDNCGGAVPEGASFCDACGAPTTPDPRSGSWYTAGHQPQPVDPRQATYPVRLPRHTQHQRLRVIAADVARRFILGRTCVRDAARRSVRLVATRARRRPSCSPVSSARGRGCTPTNWIQRSSGLAYVCRRGPWWWSSSHPRPSHPRRRTVSTPTTDVRHYRQERRPAWGLRQYS